PRYRNVGRFWHPTRPAPSPHPLSPSTRFARSLACSPTAHQRGCVSVSVPRARHGLDDLPPGSSLRPGPVPGARRPALGFAVPVPSGSPHFGHAHDSSFPPHWPPLARARPPRGPMPRPLAVRPPSPPPITPPPRPAGPRERGSGSPARPDRASPRPDGGSTRPDGASTSARQQSENGSQSPVVRRPLILAAGCGALIL